MTALLRQSLRDALRQELARRITSGAYPPGSRLNETEIARELGVSQTPIREALLSLEHEAAIQNEPRKGFHVRPLIAAEATELYTLVGHLERYALTLQGVPSLHVMRELVSVNASFRDSKSASQAQALDDAWHAILLAEVPFMHLQQTLRRLKILLLRYELAYMQGKTHVVRASAQHREIIALLRKGAVAQAGKILEKNWLSGIEPMFAWLGEKQ